MPPVTEPASAAACSGRARRKRQPTERVQQAGWDIKGVSTNRGNDVDSPAPCCKRHKTGTGSDRAASAALLEVAAAQAVQELLPTVTLSPGYVSACSTAPTAMQQAQTASAPAAPEVVAAPPAAEALPTPVPSVQRWMSHPAAKDAAPDATLAAAAAERVRSFSAGHSTVTRHATEFPPPAHLSFASDAAIQNLQVSNGNHSLRDDSHGAEQLSSDRADIAALDSSISAVLGDDISAAAAAAAAAAVSELFATRLAAAIASLSREQLKALFLAMLTRASPPAAPQHSAPLESCHGDGSLAPEHTPEDESGSAFWVGDVDSCCQPTDGSTQLLLVAGPYSSLAAALFGRPAERQVGG